MVKVKEKKILRYEEKCMLEALKAVRQDGMSVNKASKLFNVPRTTLTYKLTGKYPVARKMGPSSYLSKDHEDIIAKWIIHSQKQGFPISRLQLVESVKKLVQDLKLKTPFINGKPGKKWVELFLQRHPEISERVPQTLTVARSMVTKERLVSWFEEVDKYIKDNDLTEVIKDPKRVFNADESAFFLSPKGNKVLAMRGDKSVYRVGNDEKECLTVLLGANAAGQVLPPMVVFQYKKIPYSVANSIPDTWGAGRSDSGWMCGPIFYEYMAQQFIPWVERQNIQFPVIFFVDGHVSHITYHLSELCSEKKVVLICLLPNSTHAMQPMDIAVFRPLKTAWRKAVDSFRAEYNLRTILQEQFCIVLQRALDIIDLSKTAESGFRASGLYPFTIDGVNTGKLLTEQNETQKQKPREGNVQHNIGTLENLLYIESIIGEEKISRFKEVIDREWIEPECDRSLFNFYKVVYNSCKNWDSTTQVEPDHSEEITNEDQSIHVEGLEHSTPVTDRCLKQDASLHISPIKPGTSRDTSNDQATLDKRNSFFLNEGEKLPSPFKRCLLWPEKEISKGKRKRKEKIPYVVSGEDYKEYYRNKMEKKQNELEAKKKRKEERELKKRNKEQNIAKKKKQRKAKLMIISSESEITDDEITLYSDGQSDDFEDFEELLKEREVKKSYSNKGMGITRVDGQGKKENTLVKQNEIREGSFVIFNYEGEFFPGQVEQLQNNQAFISAMKMSGYNWKWYDKGHEDKMWYNLEDIVQLIKTPQKVNERGTYRVPEIDILKNINIK